MKRKGIIDQFSIYKTGELEVPTFLMDEQGNFTNTLGILDVDREDYRYIEYASTMIWPYVKHYNLAEPLKNICMNMYNIERELLYGTNADKNKPTQYKWSDLGHLIPRKEIDLLRKDNKWEDFITGREFAQKLGDIMRTIYTDCFVDPCINKMMYEGSELSIVGDCRFMNEFYKFKKNGAKVIKLTKSVDQDTHKSESEIDQIEDSEFDLVIDNREKSIHQKNTEIAKKLEEWGW